MHGCGEFGVQKFRSRCGVHFICHVYNVGRSGLDGWSPTEGVLQQLDKTWMSLARKSMLGLHPRAFVDNVEVRRDEAK